MIRRPTTRRPGATLLEVLIGFGILGVAVTSIITLFPYSALTVADALKNDRTTTAALSADATIRDLHKRYVVEPGEFRTQEPYFFAMDNPPAGTTLAPVSALSTEPSFPVYVDPMGVVAGRASVGGVNTITRVNLLSIIQSPDPRKLALRCCSLMDGLKYTEDGAVPASPNYDLRDLRYNFAWMLQRPSNRDRYTVRQQVIVYDRRTHLYAPPGSEAAYAVTLTPNSTTIFGVPGTAEIRRGTWVMDAGNPGAGIRHAEFYRVLSATEAANGTYTLEVHKPVVRLDGQPVSFGTWLVVIPAVADVFERPPLTAGTGP